MGKPPPRRLVIDADVLGQAGSEKSEDPRSARCHDFLMLVYQICHRAVLSDALRQEWKRHASPRARRWLTRMDGRKKIERITIPTGVSLSKRISRIPTTAAKKRELKKDAHLVEVALAADRLVASLDDKARSLFVEVSDRLVEVGKVAWINPANDRETPLDWLRAGAPAEEGRCLSQVKGTDRST